LDAYLSVKNTAIFKVLRDLGLKLLDCNGKPWHCPGITLALPWHHPGIALALLASGHFKKWQ